jgi:hypothetical protein
LLPLVFCFVPSSGLRQESKKNTNQKLFSRLQNVSGFFMPSPLFGRLGGLQQENIFLSPKYRLAKSFPLCQIGCNALWIRVS